MERTVVEGFVVDFEAAAWQSIRTVFPGREIKGCVFHWGQAVWRHVQSLGLSETYKKRRGLYTFVRMLLALPFLHAAHILRATDLLRVRATTESTRLLMAYIERQWLNNTVFPIESWSVFDQSVRTNNDVDGWHHRVNGQAGCAGLGFYRLVSLLRREAQVVRLAVDGGDLDRAGFLRPKGVPHPEVLGRLQKWRCLNSWLSISCWEHLRS